jgi:hypothetical protein
MAVYKIFPHSDATIYSAYPAKNTGLDEILEVSVKNASDPTRINTSDIVSEADDIRRSLLLFGNDDLALVKSKITGSWQSNLRLYLANAENLTNNYTLEIRPLTSSWVMGTGQFGDSPETRNGVCWYSSGSYFTTASNWSGTSQFYLTPGGGSWGNINVLDTFGLEESKDMYSNVTSIVDSWFSGSSNNGFIIKHRNSVETDPNSYIALSFFSIDTHTIFPPCLEFKWDDSSWQTGSLSVVSNNETVIGVGNIMETYKSNTTYKFRVHARDKYPQRYFTTSSLYTKNKYLPKESYWAIQDYKTEEIIIDFDEKYTKISADSESSYFTLYMNGLQPERSYKILIKTVLPDGEVLELDTNSIFKIVR